MQIKGAEASAKLGATAHQNTWQRWSHGQFNYRSGSRRPDSFASTLKVERSAVGSGSGRPELEPPMSQLGRFETLPWLGARSPTCGLAQIPPADLDMSYPRSTGASAASARRCSRTGSAEG